MQVLGIDAATPPSSVALWRGGDDRPAHRTGPFGRDTDAWILGAVEELLEETDTELPRLDLIAATAGPGAFTGIRVGLATAMGLSRGAGIPVTGVGTLETMIDLLRRQASGRAGGHALACIDARRGEVYALLAALDDDEILWGPAALAPEVVAERLGALEVPPRALGTGLRAYSEIATLVQPVRADEPLASAAARRAAALFEAGGPGALPEPRPRYLRAPDARPGSNPLRAGGD